MSANRGWHRILCPAIRRPLAAGVALAIACALSTSSVVHAEGNGQDIQASMLSPAFTALGSDLTTIAAASGGKVGISLYDLTSQQQWELNATQQFTAASTYKLPLLMANAYGIASGTMHTSDTICYQPDDWEDGWFVDYQSENCYSRGDLAQRSGQYSDNTAAHMLVRDLGGTGQLNAFAGSVGATQSALFDPNLTTAHDLTQLWISEASGSVGGNAAQQWLYPLLTHTQYEDGIPAGVPASATVVHKIGVYDQTVNDSALVMADQNHTYVLTVCTDSVSGDGWSLIAQISARVWQYEQNQGVSSSA